MTESVISRPCSPVGRVPDDVAVPPPSRRSSTARNTERSVGYVMLDCSGTTMDRYVDAPAIVFVEVFRKYGLEISMPEARAPMGAAQGPAHQGDHRDRLGARLASSRVSGRQPTQADVDANVSARLRADPDRPAAQWAITTSCCPAWPRWSRTCSSAASGSGDHRASRATCSTSCWPAGAKQGFRADTACAGDEVEMPARPPTW